MPDFFVITPVDRDPWITDVRQAIARFGDVKVLSADEFSGTRRATRPEMVIIDGAVAESLELVEQAKTRFPEAKVVLATAATDWQHARNAYVAGAAKVIEKSLGQREIVEKLISPVALMVDNKLDYIGAQAEFLRRHGWTVHLEGEAGAAKETMRKQRPDVAFLDIRLEQDTDEQDQSGLLLAAAEPSVAKVILTGFPTIQAVQAAMTLSEGGRRLAEDILDKKGSNENFLKVACRVLRDWRCRRSQQTEPGLEAPRTPDPAALKDLVEGLVSAEIESVARGEVLDNYSGHICARFESGDRQTAGGQRAPSSGGEADSRRRRGRPGILVWLQSEAPQQSGIASGSVEVRDGRAADEVTFEVCLESDGARFAPARASLTVQPGTESRHQLFVTKRGTRLGNQQVWVQVFQKNRLIQVLPTPIARSGRKSAAR